MQIILSSKNMQLTEGLKTFVNRKVAKFAKFFSPNSSLQVLIDVDHKKHGAPDEAVVEMVSDLGKKHIAVRETGKTFYKAFFGAISKMKSSLSRESDRSHEH
ncbi:MAG TPA: ribosome-associated translation inhibitor RaiA [Patescibacteria group bacterium]|nr:ribosome-associated translation inhibitor RaiA [Patescibacteria group bacterium]